ncbi:MAG: 4Fe-4S dicluster domain-containing protein [Chloroflexota bacterium]
MTTDGDSPQTINLTINGVAVAASPAMTLVEAAWHGGVPRVTAASCLESVCGSCRVLLRRGKEVTVNLACQTFVEEGIEAVFLPPQVPPLHHYDIASFTDGWNIQARFHEIFPEASHCRNCHGCVRSCPKGIDVEGAIALAAAGHFRDAGEAFLECVMCELCDSACPELIAPAHVGLFCRRITAHFHLRPPNLIYRLEEQRKEKMGDAGASGDKHD